MTLNLLCYDLGAGGQWGMTLNLLCYDLGAGGQWGMTLNLLCYDLGAGGQHVQGDAPSVRALDEGELLQNVNVW